MHIRRRPLAVVGPGVVAASCLAGLIALPSIGGGLAARRDITLW